MASVPKAALVMGSDSDFPQLQGCVRTLKDFGIMPEVRVMSAHRTPHKAAAFAETAEKNGFDVIIAAAGKAAHLPGVLAAFTTLPVIGVPMKSSTLDGLDSLLSIVQMPKGIPVATVAVDGGDNAAILAAQILALKFPQIKDKLAEFKAKMAAQVEEKDAEIKKAADRLLGIESL
jgi:5-(carboxyamino)imidazole ribonucleotide mutase